VKTIAKTKTKEKETMRTISPAALFGSRLLYCPINIVLLYSAFIVSGHASCNCFNPLFQNFVRLFFHN